jgi:hypothetical protein
VRRTILLAPLLLLALLAASCGGDEPAAPPTASTGAPQSTSPGPLPTSSPGGATGTVVSGNATIQLGGDLSGTVQLLMLGTPAVYSPPPGSTALSWTDGLQTMTITGTSFTDTQPTSAVLTLTLNMRDGAELLALASSAGECTITVDTAVERSFAGSFSCKDLVGTTSTEDFLSVDATGTFTAAG